MKKFFLTALIAVSIISSSFAKGTSTVNYKVKNSFNFDFKGASDVQWTASDAYVTASFVLNQKSAKAFYNHDGTLIGSASAITIDDLPAAAKRSFAKRYAGYTITEALKFDNEEGISYYITAENAGEKVILEVGNSQVSLYKKLG